jgi:ubiquinone/menaquinone biosynthesis C-methylase UbiE
MLRVLEVNEAGTLTKFLAKMMRRELACYPHVDMQAMPYPDNHFDLVVHSDTLEHVPDPVKGLCECRRVLKPGGFCCFTIPIVVNRLTRSRRGLPASYHGCEYDKWNDYVVATEYGSDFWHHVFHAGFTECRISSFEFPAALAIATKKHPE